MNTLGNLLQELRGKRSLREIAKIVELSHTYISDLEKGVRTSPKPETLRKLSNAYNYPYEKLLETAGYIHSLNIDTDYSLKERELIIKSRNLTNIQFDLILKLMDEMS